MPAPTPDHLLVYLDELIAAKVTEENKHPIFEWKYLLTNSFRAFKSTSNAVRARMEKLLEDGRLVRVRVSAEGYVSLGVKEFDTSLFNVYFQYDKPYEYAREDCGYVTHVRSGEHDNVWRSGDRYLFTTQGRYDEMVTDLLDAKRKQDAAKGEERKEKKRKVQEALDSIAPDARELLDRFRELGRNAEADVRLRSSVWDDDEEEGGVSATFNLYGSKALAVFLDVLRNGLPDVPRETSTD
jgi:hypothetical protein